MPCNLAKALESRELSSLAHVKLLQNWQRAANFALMGENPVGSVVWQPSLRDARGAMEGVCAPI